MALLAALAASFVGGVAAWDPSLYTSSPAVLPSREFVLEPIPLDDYRSSIGLCRVNC